MSDELDRLISNLVVAARIAGFDRGRGRDATDADKLEDAAVQALRGHVYVQDRDAERFRWLLRQEASVQDAVLRPPVPPDQLEKPETWPDLVRSAIDRHADIEQP